MKTLTIAGLGAQVSRLGLGTVKIGRNHKVSYPQDFSLPDDKTVLNLFAIAHDAGINLLDTAPAYGCSEQRLGKLLGRRLNEWVVISKAGEEFDERGSRYDFSPQAITQSVTRSLKHLKRDYIDILLIHSNGEDTKIMDQETIFETLAELKRVGYIRLGGISSKTVAGGIASLHHADCVMATYNPIMTAEKPVLDEAAVLNKPVFIKKAFCSGHLDKFATPDPIQHSLNFIFSHPAPSHVIIGTLNPVHLRQNIDTLLTLSAT